MTQSPVTRRSGLTLVEILIAMVMTLIVLFAMMEAFKYASGEMQRSRAVIEMSNQLRAAQELLRSDLEHVTLDPKPWTQTALPKGYFEYVESKGNDKEPWEPLQSNDDQNVQPPNYPPPSNYDNYLGDVDDVWRLPSIDPNNHSGDVTTETLLNHRWLKSSGGPAGMIVMETGLSILMRA